VSSDPSVSLADQVGAACGAAVVSARPIAGGDINEAWAMELGDGRRLFVKTRADAAAGEYSAEAAGLRWLGEAIAVPEVVAVSDAFLALELVERGSLDGAGEEAFGRSLAAMHAGGAEAFGFAPGGGAVMRLGSVVLPNEPRATWAAFYAECRLAPAAAQAGLSAAVDPVCARIDELVGPAEPPARLHGDLWSGNVLAGADGRTRLIDPAAYGGHREVDLAMLHLFGTIPPRTWAAYEELLPLADGHEQRVGLYQLFPLLVHAALFGGGYVARARALAARLARW
jgi:fructosamine-3-kinase